MSRNVPRDVTLLKRDLGTASVIRLSSEGRRYYHRRIAAPSGRAGEAGPSWRYERKDYLLIEGQRWDLVERVEKAAKDYRAACEQHDHDRERVKWKAQDEWDEAHPRPTLPKVEDIIQEIEKH